MPVNKDKIVFLDAGTLDYGDVSFREIEKLGLFKSYRVTAPSQIEKRVRGARIVITNKCVFDHKMLLRMKTLKSLNVAATGTNNVDLITAKKYGIAVTNVAGYSTESVAQFTMLFILALATQFRALDSAAHNGTWSQSSFFTLTLPDIREVHGKILGILGFGRIGRKVKKAAQALGMKTLVGMIPGRRYSASERKQRVPFKHLIAQSDFLTLHAPLSPITQDLIDERVIRKMKKGSFIINMARGGIVNERALLRALRTERLAGAASDVLMQEPPPENHPLLGAPNFLLTPHVAWATVEARKRLIREIALNIKAFQKGARRNRVV